MSAPRYYRAADGRVWLAVILLAFAACWALYVTASNGVDRIRQTERDRVYNAAKEAAAMVLPAERAMWGRRLDSLERVTARQDSALAGSLERVRALLARRPRVDTLTDTVVVPAITLPGLVLRYDSLARGCSALVDSCAAFRDSTAVKDSITRDARHADSLALGALAVGNAELRGDIATARAGAERQAKRQHVKDGALVTSLLLNALAWFAR